MGSETYGNGMQNNNWEKIEAILDKALTLPEKDWEPYVKKVCGNDERLIKEVKSVLWGIRESEKTHFLERASLDHKELIDDLKESQSSFLQKESFIGKKIGPFQIEEMAGSGGMASVYRAERVDGQFHQSVAIKIIKQGIFSDQTAYRFKVEQEILASLHHPNIAQLYDGGLTAKGIPYLVMEYVDGIPIDVYANKHKLTIRQRLNLFIKVCNAVQYAHNNLVVHRDLKAQNILVNKQGNAKILDFGVAKLMDPTSSDITLVQTTPGQRFWTPQYASPELVEGLSISIASDIYALGVLLHKLLTDTYPLDLRDKTYTQIHHIIPHKPPVTASHSIRQSKTAEPTAKNRGLHANDLIKTLKGDLDSIVLKAIHKEPDERFESVRHFVEDIQRYLQNRPVLARKTNFRYRIRKFSKRNVIPITSVAATVLLIAGIITYYTVLITEQRNKAQNEAYKAHQVTNFMIGIFKNADPYNQNKTDLTAREILDKGTQRIKNQIKDQPDIKATLLYAVGGIYEDLGIYDKAGPLLHQALKIRQKLYPTGNDELANSLHMWADYNELTGHYDISKKYFKKSRAMFLRLQEDSSFAASTEELGWVYYLTGDYHKADSLVNLSLKIFTATSGTGNNQTARGYQYLAWINNDEGNYKKADSLFRLALALRKNIYQGDHPLIAQTMQSLGKVLYNEQNYDTAEVYESQALAMQKKLFGDKHPEIATSLNILGLIKQKQHHYDISGKYLREAYKMRRDIYGKKDPLVMRSLGDLATNYFYGHEYLKAASVFKKVAKRNEQMLGADHPDVATDYNNLAMCLWKGGKKYQAVTYFKKAIHVDDKALRPAHPKLVYLRKNLADLYQELDEFDKAEKLRIENLSALKKHNGLEDPATQTVLKRVIDMYNKWDKPEQVEHYKAMLDGKN